MKETSVRTIAVRTQIRTGHITNINLNSVPYSDWASVRTIRDSIPDWDNRIASSRKTSRPALGAHTASYLVVSGVLSQELKRPKRSADHSPLASAEVKNEYSSTSTPPLHLHSVERDTFIFTFNCTFTICSIHWSFTRGGCQQLRQQAAELQEQ
jgi:hypothetical protein